MVRAAQISIMVSLAWGTLAFGATYEWASRSLAVLAVIASALCFAAARRAPGPRAWIPVTMTLMLIAIGVQLVPLSQATITDMNPERQRMLEELWLGYRFNALLKHPLSINPPLTLWAFIFCAVSFVWVLAVSKLLAKTGVKWLAKGLTILGVVISAIGIIQNAVYDGRVYGFWTPEDEFAGPFGPFINRNHFAGWILMVLPLTACWFAAGARRALGSVKTSWRERFLWLSSPNANRLLLVAGAACLMTMALVLTLSRSGLLALLVVIAFMSVLLLRTVGGRLTRITVALAPLVVAALIVTWAGQDVSDRIQTIGSGDWADGRLRAWSDGYHIGRRFPVAGIGLNTYGTATLVSPSSFTLVHYSQAHNDYLQLWVEGGVLLCIPALLLSIAIVAGITRRFRERSGTEWLRSGAVLGMIAILMQEVVDFSLQMPANLLLFATLCAIALHASPVRPPDTPSLRGAR